MISKKTDTNRIIQGFWLGDSLGPMETMCIRSYQAQGHEFHLYMYEDVKNVPAGTVIMNAGEILPIHKIFIDDFGGYVNLSNHFRYMLLYKLGGWWVDMDTVCLRYFDCSEDLVFSSEFSDPYKRILINTTFIKSRPREEFLLNCLDFIEKRGHQHLHWGELGVNLLSRSILQNNLGKYVASPASFCPVSPYQLSLLVNDPDYMPPEDAYAIHWWNEAWKKAGIDKNAPFRKLSLFQRMIDLYS